MFESLNKLEKLNNTPTPMEAIYFFYLDRGVSLNEFNELPIPYIIGNLNTFQYIQKQEEKARKIASRKQNGK